MLTPILIVACVFVCVTAFIAACVMTLNTKTTTGVEDRLDLLTSATMNPGGEAPATLISGTLDETKSVLEELFSQFIDLRRFLDQADVSIMPSQFLMLTIGLLTGPAMLCFLMGLPFWVGPTAGLVCGAAPFTYVFIRRRRRIAAFTRQLPDALELISRALRAGHSLAAGFNLVGDELAEPISREFNRCYEEQNLGIPLEEALDGMTERVPNLDLRFFATAVILQRTTGGDLAEILDKIGELIRERFKIWGQIQALTGEGRLSGIVLLALPPLLFVVMYRLNPDYVMLLFNDPIGQWMLASAVLLQLVGAFVIKKIITIKV